MSSGVYALLGVLLGGLVTVGANWFQAWRTARSEWLVASRLLTDELERLMVDLRLLVQNSTVPLRPGTSFLDTSVWEEYRTVIARGLPNPEGDRFWRELSRVHSVLAHHVRPWLSDADPGAPLDLEFLDHLRRLFGSISAAYNALADTETEVRLELPTGAQTGGQQS